MRTRAHAPGARLGLLLAAAALLPGVIALIAAGPGVAPTSALAITEAAGAFSMVAIQGLERRAADTASLAADVAPVEIELPMSPARYAPPDPSDAPYERSAARVLSLRL